MRFSDNPASDKQGVIVHTYVCMYQLLKWFTDQCTVVTTERSPTTQAVLKTGSQCKSKVETITKDTLQCT